MGLTKKYQHLAFDPIFICGLILKLLAIFLILPFAVRNWYVPFLSATAVLGNVSWDPWGLWLAQGNTHAMDSFPYGYVMWLVFLPLNFLFDIVGIDLSLGYAVTLLFFDLFLLAALMKFSKDSGSKRVLYIYWLSPIVILTTYLLGFNDLVPVVFLTFAMIFLREHSYRRSGLLLAAAISAKLSMVLSLPFFVIYFIRNKSLFPYLSKFFTGILLGAVIFVIPTIFSTAALAMLLGNPELEKTYLLSIGYSQSIVVYIVPLLYFFLLYIAWSMRRLNFDLFYSVTGLSFLLIILMTPASPGWYIWTIPFLVLYQLKSDKSSLYLVSLFSILFVMYSLIQQDIFWRDGVQLFQQIASPFGNIDKQKISSLFLTATVATGLLISIRLWRDSIGRNDYFRFSRRPYAIGIAGDSGAGKDTYVNALAGMFGKHSVVTLSGDDYHLWDRHKPMWQVMTHLNPMANQLEAFTSDLIDLYDGKEINSKHYDHATGKMSHATRIKSNNFILASGLHALYLPIMRDCYDLKIFLDIAPTLRKYFKIKRDVLERNHPLSNVITSFKVRERDSEAYIRPQAKHADLVFSLQPIHSGWGEWLENIDESSLQKNLITPPRLKLVARTRRGYSEMSLVRVLVGICGLHVDIDSTENELILTIEGEASSEDIRMAASILCKSTLDFLDIFPCWESGTLGLMQLITLSHIQQTFAKRIM
jgi:uridine kinase